MDPSNPRDRDLIKIAAAVASTLRDRDDLESVSVAEPSLSEEEMDRMLPDVRRVKLSDRPHSPDAIPFLLPSGPRYARP